MDFTWPEAKKLCRLSGEALERYHLIAPQDRILVGVSGGKDSMVLLHLLHHWQDVAPIDFEVIAVTFDPGYAGFNPQAIAAYCRKRKWAHHTISLPVADIITEKNWTDAPCVLCSRLRRGKLYGLAQELSCNKLALGHHLDDIIASFLMSLSRGQGVKSMAPLVHPGDPAAPTVIRPLALVPEELIRQVAKKLTLPEAGHCPYEVQLNSGDRAYFGQLIDQLAARIPGFRGNVARSLTHVELKHLMLVPDEETK